jgi:hypothetical protein
MGPPLTKIAGTFARSAPMTMPGTILSQLGMQTRPSKPWARTMDSTESAMSSRLGSEYFIPAWPMAMPSQMPMVLNSNPTPPVFWISALTRRPNFCKCTWPGMISTKELQMPMNGLEKSSSLTPQARRRLRCGARSNPSLTRWLYITPRNGVIARFRSNLQGFVKRRTGAEKCCWGL